MDIATIIGLVLGLGLVLGSIGMGSGGLMPFINVPSMMITIGGSFAALLINFPLGSCLGMLGVVKNCFLQRLPSPKEVMDQFRELAGIARKEGFLALESKMEEISDRFLSRGLGLVVSGSTKEEIQAVLDTEISYIDERHRLGKKIVDSLGASAPAFGMIGTLIGLVQMLRSLDDPSQIGSGMATALLTTLYGALFANLLCIPLAGKLEARNKEEIMIREMMVDGLVSMVEGKAPRNIEGRLASFISPKTRPDEEATTAA